jgi:spore germination protein GerM
MPDINTAVLELVKGPKKDSGLQGAVPSDCGLIDVKVTNGVAAINFSQEFAQLASATDGGQQALRALILTCMQYPGVKQVQLLVDGQPYTPSPIERPTFVNSATQVANQFPGVIETD